MEQEKLKELIDGIAPSRSEAAMLAAEFESVLSGKPFAFAENGIFL